MNYSIIRFLVSSSLANHPELSPDDPVGRGVICTPAPFSGRKRPHSSLVVPIWAAHILRKRRLFCGQSLVYIRFTLAYTPYTFYGTHIIQMLTHVGKNILSRTLLDSRHTVTGPSAARVQGWAKVEQRKSNCRGMLPSNVQGGIHKVNCVAREGPPEEPLGMCHSSPSALGHSVSRQGMSTI